MIVILGNDRSRERACEAVRNAPEGHVCAIRPATRTDEQNDKLHPMIRDIRRQVEGMGAYTEEDIKLRFLNALGAEMRFLPELEGAGMFPVGLRSSTLTKEQFSGLLELLYAYGAKHGVQWSDPQEQAA
jgi:hypothetical protein